MLLLFDQAAVAENRLVISQNDKPDFKCEAVFKEGIAKFYFINEAGRYQRGLEWNKETKSAIEYSWIIYFKKEYEINSKVYNGIDISVRYFSKNAKKENGDLARLISLSEVNSFGYSSNGFVSINIDSDSFNVVVENEDLILTVHRKPDTSFIFNDYPDNAHFWVIADGETPRKCLVRICK